APRVSVRWLDDGSDAEGVGDYERGHLRQRANVGGDRDVEPVVAVDKGELHDQQGGQVSLGGLKRAVVGGRVLELPPSGRGHAAEGDVVRQEVERLDGGRGRGLGAARRCLRWWWRWRRCRCASGRRQGERVPVQVAAREVGGGQRRR